jgi:hypothetical protein
MKKQMITLLYSLNEAVHLIQISYNLIQSIFFKENYYLLQWKKKSAVRA